MTNRKQEMEIFFQKVRTYTTLNAEAEKAWKELLSENHYRKGDEFVQVGQVPRKVAFIITGLFAQHYLSPSGDKVIKYFFPEGRIAGSIPATLTRSPSLFAIEALEETQVLEYDFHEFKNLVKVHPCIAEFYIRYMEQHWVIDKEPGEISLRHDSAGMRYSEFLQKNPALVKRLKKHHIAAYLGVTPTQLSRILAANE